MVSTHLVDAIRDPSHVIIDLYDEGGSPQMDFPAQVTSHFATVFRMQDSIQRIPQLSLSYPPDAHPDRSLVRFRGMIQDIPSPEMYLSRLPEGRCGGWNIYQGLDAPTPTDINFHDLRKCSVFWAITVPGESQWYAERLEGTLSNQGNTHRLLSSSRPNCVDYTTFVGILTWESILRLSPPEFVRIVTETEPEAVVPVIQVTGVQVPSPKIPSEPRGNAIIAVYEALVNWVSQEALAGDRDAAELIILCSVARVQSRNPSIMPPSLQLTRFPSPKNGIFVPAICSVLSKLLPLFSVVKLSLEALNNDRFIPESNGEDLSSGYLQVPAGSVILIAENGIQEGNVVEKGMRSLKDVQDVMSNQNLRYAFPFSQLSFNTEIGFILLVEGRRSPFFTTDILLPLQPQSMDTTPLYKSESEIKIPDQGQLDDFRNLLFSAKRREKAGMPKQLAELIENDFVEERKGDKSVTQNDLMMKITIVRLLGLLFQAEELSVELWERAKELEVRRKKRSQV
ncbi:hypothetical protein BDM02DRAFT_3099124 [Thelephora ganbajun]|uniref:Uncharacterized protein n=1 Tax=Thelephora ganbajun TaxID=370292 RepID=A0ACB6ZAT3_THEGA|nr:hypothetical protein BDM02DRAFT_3099124 [Thelephora ganbajun]